MDAPSHFKRNGKSVSDLSIANELIGAACVVDVQEQAQCNADYQLSVDDLLAWERKHQCKIPSGAIVCMRSGWSRFYNSNQLCEKYYNRNESGVMHFPSFSKSFPVHHLVLGADKYILENLNLNELPECGALFIALPLKMHPSVRQE